MTNLSLFIEGKKGPSEIKIMIPGNNSQTGKTCFDHALEVAPSFDNIVTNNPQYTHTDDTLITNYQNHVLSNTNYQTYWIEAINTNPDQKIPIILINLVLFSKFATPSLILLPLPVVPLLLVTAFSVICIVARGKKKPQSMSPQSFYTRFQKALHAVKLLDRCYEKELDDAEAKSTYFAQKIKCLFSFLFHYL